MTSEGLYLSEKPPGVGTVDVEAQQGGKNTVDKTITRPTDDTIQYISNAYMPIATTYFSTIYFSTTYFSTP